MLARAWSATQSEKRRPLVQEPARECVRGWVPWALGWLALL
jgi:hypothetical protein